MKGSENISSRQVTPHEIRLCDWLVRALNPHIGLTLDGACLLSHALQAGFLPTTDTTSGPYSEAASS